jgi:hypothetical protein
MPHAARLLFNARHSLEVLPQRLTSSADVAIDAPLQTVSLTLDPLRTDKIVAEVTLGSYKQVAKHPPGSRSSHPGNSIAGVPALHR